MSLRGTWVVGCVATLLGFVHGVAGAQQASAQARFTDADQLVIDFPSPVQAWDNPVGEGRIRLQPDVPRTCRWDSDTRLACRFERDLAPATRYRIDIPAEYKTFDGKRVPALRLFAEYRRPSLQAGISDWEGGAPVIELSSTAPATPEALRATLRLYVDDAPATVPLPTPLPKAYRADRFHRFRLRLPALAGADRAVRLAVVPGLRSTAGPLTGTQDATLLKALVNESFALRSLSCPQRDGEVRAVNRDGSITARCLPGMPIHVSFSRPLSHTSRNAIAQHPPEGLRIAESGGWWPSGSTREELSRAPGGILSLEALRAEHAYVLTLDDLRSEDGASLAPVRIALSTDAEWPQLRAPHTGALVADGKRLPELVQSINGGGSSVEVDAIAGKARRQSLALPNGNGSAPHAIASRVAMRALADGGWVSWDLGDKATARYGLGSNGPAQFAAPDFDLYAVHGLREVLVWANEWDRDAPVAGAAVELLLREKPGDEARVVARGTTGEDGVALLRIPDEVALPRQDAANQVRPMWLVRASHERRGRRAVLPMETHWASFGQGLERITWGVTDRPMYRAGDTVRYHLWQRDRNGALLQPIGDGAVLTLRLHDEEEDRTVLQWEATPSSGGALSGTLQLPVHLTDATYCIGTPDPRGYQTDGACFFVGTYRAQDLWAQLRSAGGVLRDGERFSADLTAGYYSGGVAAGVAIQSLDLSIAPLEFTQAYPDYAAYDFIDVWDDAYDVIALEVDVASGGDGDERLDRDGTARLQATLPLAGDAQRPPFGEVELSLDVAPQGREATVASDAATRYSRYPAFVGLRTIPDWPDAGSPVRLEGVLVDPQGRALTEGDIAVDVEFVRGTDAEATTEHLARCTLRAGRPAPCEFVRPGSGLYRFTASSGDAAPTRLQRYLWTGDAGVRAQVEETEMDVIADGDASMRATLRQPFDRGRALFVFASQDRIDGYQVEALTGNVGQFVLPRPAPGGRPSQRLQAYVRAFAPEKARIDDGFRTPVWVDVASAALPTVEATVKPAPLRLQFEPVRTTPGAVARVVVRNDSDTPRDVVLTVMDDALRSLAQRWLEYADPDGFTFLGRLREAGGRFDNSGFADFVDDRPWRRLLPWPQDPAAVADTEGEDEDAADVATGAAADERFREAPMPPPPGEPTLLADNPSAVDQPAAAPPDSGTLLDRIEVTGSRIRRTDLESREAKAPDPSLRPRDPRAASNEPSLRARVRSRFADTAAWHADLRLAPGETRTIEVELPDNLTRWRAVAWSSDDTDGFAMTEATLETGLALEARLQAPVRIYPGDRSRVIANVRQTGDSPSEVHATLHFEGEHVPADRSATLRLAAKGQGAFAGVIEPQRETMLTAIASASAVEGRDAVAQPIEVASPRIAARKVLAGWLGDAPVSLDVPTLPHGASHATVHVGLRHGATGMVDDWTDYMRTYPHRCWEQILSRAVAAALALDRGDTAWTDAPAVVREALDNAAVFQQGDGGFVYFTGGHAWIAPQQKVVLTAYTAEAFALLRRLGHPVDAGVEARAATFLARVAPPAAQAGRGDEGEALARFAYAAAARKDVSRPQLDRLWHEWNRLPLPAQVAAARALAGHAHPQAAQATQRLLAATVTRGEARVLEWAQRDDAWMSSRLREQCGLIALLRAESGSAADPARGALVAGLTDLYAGGAPSVDTQSAAVCLMALHDVARGDVGSFVAQVGFGNARGELRLAPDRPRADWSAPLTASTSLRLAAEPSTRPSTPAAFIAQVQYEEDARVARASAIGLSIERRYAVFRDGDWRSLERSSIREGDWVRVTLVIDSTAPRRFVAVTDQAPGGLRPTDLSLSGVVVRDIERASDTGSAAFATRRLDARTPRFYAESLPAGRHEVHYFAVAGNGGDYLAAPAMAELMYGGASTARTASVRVRILADGP